MDNKYYVYILTNRARTTLYVGVTYNMCRRLAGHKQGLNHSFTKKYNVDTLVYAEQHRDIDEAIAREKQIKRWSRSKKEWLISTINPDWSELEPF